MIAALFGGIVVLVVGCALWARAAAARADGRSIEGYEQIRKTLGGVSKRSEAAVMSPPNEEVARIHVRVGEEESSVSPSQMVRPAIAPRIHLESAIPGETLPVFGETEATAVRGHGPLLRARPHRRRRTGIGPRIDAELVLGNGDGAHGLLGDQVAALDDSGSSSDTGARLRPQKRAIGSHRVGIGSLAVVAAVIVGVATWQVSEHHSGTGRPQVSTQIQHTHGSKAPVLKIAAPSTLEPTSITTSVVRFAEPSKSYTLSFSASNPCWIGIQKVVNGPYLWMTTLGANGTGTYRASGSVVVRIGSPPSLSMMRANGVPVELPAQNVAPYDATFS